MSVDREPRDGWTAAAAAIDALAPTTSTEIRRHAAVQRGTDALPTSSTTGGRFGRMFRELPLFTQTDESLLALARTMIQPAEEEKPPGDRDDDENERIAAGYTYLGQFIDHDLTFDPASSLQRQNDPDALYDFRTPRPDLDSIYGRGPADQPYLYAPDGCHFAIGRDVGDRRHDLPRNSDGRALIGDPRNDENRIVSQLHALLLDFHNAVVDHVAEANIGLTAEDAFKQAQQLVRWHYQWIILSDFLPLVVGDEVMRDILREEDVVYGGTTPRTVALRRPHLAFFAPEIGNGFMPVEFSAAAYRFGHSIVRPSYFLNDRLRERRISDHPHAPRVPLVSLAGDARGGLNGFRPLPSGWGVDWAYFFPLDTKEPRLKPQLSYRIDTQLVHPLGRLPEVVAPDVHSLAERNLLRGSRLALPSGQVVARAMGIEPLSQDQLGLEGLRAAAPELSLHTPLWYYVLREAEMLGGGTLLGPVGGRIVAEVLVGLLAADPLAFVNVEPNWRPERPFASTPGVFGMPELISFVYD